MTENPTPFNDFLDPIGDESETDEVETAPDTFPDDVEEEVAEVIPTDDDGYLAPPDRGSEEPVVVVQDYDPADPAAPIAEPQKVLRPHDRIQRKRDRGSRE